MIFVPIAQATSEVIVDKQAAISQVERAENIEHEKKAQENGGLLTSCDGADYDSVQAYLDQEDYADTFIGQGIDKIQSKRDKANQLTNDLKSAENIQSISDPIVTKEMEELTAKADAAKAEMNRLRDELSKIPYTSSRDNPVLASKRNQIFREYLAARSKYNSLRRQAANKEGTVNSAITNATTKQETQIASDAISGCSGSGSTKTCELSGTLFEKDQELTEMANANISEAINLAKKKSDALLDLELQSQYNGDYKLFESAILLGGDLNLSDLDNVQNDPRKTRNIAMAISNIKALALASAGVKDLECKKESKSEADSKSYHLFRAAAATYLMAQMNDTSLYTNTTTCRATENYTSDSKNLQIRTIERAANITQEQLENVCLRVNPTPPTGTYDWKIYGDTQEEALQRVANLTQLKTECDAYLTKLRGPEYVDKPRTREAALEMMETALTMAYEELAAKREKVSIAQANIKKGEAWVKRVKSYIATMIAMAVALRLAAQFFFSLPWCAGCAKGAALTKKSMYIIAVVVGIYLISELARANAFLKKWKEKMDLAKSFTHLACNYKDAISEEGAILEMAEKAKEEMLIEVNEVKNETIEELNNLVNSSSTNVTVPESSYHKPVIEYLLELIPNAYAASETTVERRDPKRLSRSLGVAYGSESFRFFLAQKVQHWKYQSTNITTNENFSKKQLVSRDKLVSLYTGGGSEDPLKDLSVEDKNGFPIPETRVVAIESAVSIFSDNINRINGVIGDVAYQREEYVNLLNEMRARLDIQDTGLSNNDQIKQEVTESKGFCLNNDGGLDQSCSCKGSNSCQNYKIGKTTEFGTGAIRDDSENAQKYANDVLSGNLGGANITAGSLQSRKLAIKKQLLESREQLNQSRKNVGLPPRNIASEASDALNKLNSSSLKTLSGSLSSTFGSNNFANRLGLATSTGKNIANSKDSDGMKANITNMTSTTPLINKRSTPTKPNFKFNASPSDINGNGQSDRGTILEEERYKHVRNLDKKKATDGIEKNRDKTIFSIISKRYETTAFPVFLTP